MCLGLGAVTNLATTSVSHNEITVSWTAATGNPTDYQYSTNGSTYTAIGSLNTTFIFTSLTASTSYTLYIRATNAGGESDSASITQTTNQIPAPGAVTNLATTSVSHNEIGVSWTAATGNPADYEYSTDGNTYTAIGSLDTTFIFTGLSASTSYTLYIRATNAGGAGTADSIAVTTNQIPPPSTPTDLATTSVTHNQIAVQWTNPSDGTITSYQYSTDDVAYNNITSSNQNTTAYTFTGLTPTPNLSLIHISEPTRPY